MEDYSAIRITMSEAIKLKCQDCCCGQKEEVRQCRIKSCSVWRFRTGQEQRDSLYTPNRRGSKLPSVLGFQTVESIVDGVPTLSTESEKQ